MICPSCQATVSERAGFCANCGARVEDPLIGTTLNDRYRVEKKIATGGFGAIFRATQLNNGRLVAIKVMHKELAADANLVARFRREGVVLCNLRDAHTVTTYELDQTSDNRLFIVMELLEGTNLLDVYRASGKLPWQRVFAIARSVCSALAEAHALGIVHRDLKPANIYLENRRGEPDYVKVLDFGIAKILQDSAVSDDGNELTQMGQAVGTLEYMAPEQLMGGKCDGRTDIYTLGVVAYEMICGRRPFAEAVGLDLLTVQLADAVKKPSELATVPEGVEQVLLKMLASDAHERYADVVELAHAIEAVLVAEAAMAPVWNEPRPQVRATTSPPPPRDTDRDRDKVESEKSGPPAEAAKRAPANEAPKSEPRKVDISLLETIRGVGPAPAKDTIPSLEVPDVTPQAIAAAKPQSNSGDVAIAPTAVAENVEADDEPTTASPPPITPSQIAAMTPTSMAAVTPTSMPAASPTPTSLSAAAPAESTVPVTASAIVATAPAKEPSAPPVRASSPLLRSNLTPPRPHVPAPWEVTSNIDRGADKALHPAVVFLILLAIGIAAGALVAFVF